MHMKLVNFRIIPLLLIAALAFSACNKEDDENEPMGLTADAGPDIPDAVVGVPVEIDGSGSSSTEGSFDYIWAITQKPQGSQANIQDETAAQTQFTPDIEGTYTVQLTITNGSDSDTDQLEVVATSSSENAIVVECEEINTATTWSNHASGVDYIVEAGCYFGVVGATLTIEPGTTVEFGNDAGIWIGESGALNAQGSSGNIITFTGAQKTRGFWKGLNFYATNNIENELEYVLVEYGGSDYETQYSNVALGNGGKSRLSITNTTLREASNFGFYMENDESEIDAFANNTITSNGEGAVFVHQHAAGMLDASTNYTGNDIDAAFINTEINYPTDLDMTWQKLDVPYRITGSGLTVVSEVTIDAGTNIEFEQDTRIVVRDAGSLDASGSAGNPITFTGVEKTPGYWQGILFRNTVSNNNKLHYCVVEYGGGNDTDDANIKIGRNNKAVVSINNSTIRNASKFGILLLQDESELLSFQNNVITSNGEEPVYIDQHAVGMLDASTAYTGNTSDYVRVEGHVNYPFENDQTWQMLDVPYFLETSVGIEGALTINPGVTIVMNAATAFYFRNSGTVNAVGTQSQPITFTGMEQVKGYWNHIENHSSNSLDNRFEYCVIEYGGSDDALYLSDRGDSRVFIENCTFRHSSGHGIEIDGSNSNFNADLETVNTFEDIDGDNVILP